MGNLYNTKGDAALAHTVQARISGPEKAALDDLVRERAKKLQAEGITGQGTFGAWLRAMIRREASATGRPVVDPEAPAPAPPTRKVKATSSAKPKGRR